MAESKRPETYREAMERINMSMLSRDVLMALCDLKPPHTVSTCIQRVAGVLDEPVERVEAAFSKLERSRVIGTKISLKGPVYVFNPDFAEWKE
jgi:hypothetical protein